MFNGIEIKLKAINEKVRVGDKGLEPITPSV